MRIVLSLLISAGIVVGLSLFMQSRSDQSAPPDLLTRAVEDVLALEVTATFSADPDSAEPDPFAPNFGAPEEGGDSSGPRRVPIAVEVAGKQRRYELSDVEAGIPAVIEPLEGLEMGSDEMSGRNELVIEANPPEDVISQAHAVRVRILRDGQPIAEWTFWTERYAPLTEAFELTLIDPLARFADESAH